jgi:ribosomal protein L31
MLSAVLQRIVLVGLVRYFTARSMASLATSASGPVVFPHRGEIFTRLVSIPMAPTWMREIAGSTSWVPIGRLSCSRLNPTNPHISHSTLIQHLFNIDSKSIQHPFNMDSTFIQHGFNIHSTSIQHPFNIHSTSVQHSFNIHSTSIQHRFNIHSTFVQHPFNIGSASIKHPFNIHSTFIQTLTYSLV